MPLTLAQQHIHDKLLRDFVYFASVALKVGPAAGGAPVYFKLNRSQAYVNHCLELQLAETGLIRAIILKARRHGMSTLIAGRHYHRSSMREGSSSIILAHDSKTTRELFNMIKGFRENAPEELKPEIDKSNAQELVFSRLNSRYSAMTAGSTQTGRGFTAQCIHATEVAYYAHADALIAGVLQTVEYLPGTEIIFESTANGKGNRFHSMVTQALRGIGDFRVIFCPWYWHDSYSRDLPPDFKLTAEEVDLASSDIEIPQVDSSNHYTHMKKTRLTSGQLYWRRMKIAEFRTDSDPVGKFRQEYPASVGEAFQRGEDVLILSSKILPARKFDYRIDPYAPVLMGCDLARTTNVIAFSYRQGRVLLDYEVIPSVEISENPTLVLAGTIASRIQKYNVEQCFIDYGHGHGVYDVLKSLGYERKVTLVSFAQAADEPLAYNNKRTEMHVRLRDWIHGGGVKIPDRDELEAQLSAIPGTRDIMGKLSLMPKDQIEAATGLDLGILDSVILTFAMDVLPKINEARKPVRIITSESGIKKSSRSWVSESVLNLMD